ncbi:hypothetical protein EV175_006609, partial [Coemansia sp. RSA 1933]
MCTEPLVPCPRSLLEAIQRSIQLAGLRLPVTIQTVGYLDVQVLINGYMKECCLDIHTVDREAKLCCKSKDNSNRLVLDNRSKHISVVESRTLLEAPDNKTALVQRRDTITTGIGNKVPACGKDVPIKLWDYAIAHANNVLNCLPKKINNMALVHELLHAPYELKTLRTFGFLVESPFPPTMRD